MATLMVFRGHVQGVGFRYQTYRIAQNYSVQGWVRNCSDGSVEIMLQGDASEVNEMLKDVQDRMQYHIRSTESRTVADDSACTSFEIRL